MNGLPNFFNYSIIMLKSLLTKFISSAQLAQHSTAQHSTAKAIFLSFFRKKLKSGINDRLVFSHDDFFAYKNF